MTSHKKIFPSPFKFLDPYEKEDVKIFFGRARETEFLYRALQQANLSLIYGPSGVGKTSLIHCGLANKFSDSDWYPLFIRRGSNLMDSISQAIRKHAIEAIPPSASLKEAINSLYLDHFIPIYLILDQFEEILISGSKKEQNTFFITLSDLLSANLSCKIILIIQEDYLGWLSKFEKFVPSLFENRFRVEPMSQTALKDVIRGTLNSSRFNIKVEKSKEKKIAEKIIKNLEGNKKVVDLGNLQVYLHRLYQMDQERKEKEHVPDRDTRFDLELIRSVGKLPQVLGDFLDEQMDIIDQELEEPGISLEVLSTFVSNEGTRLNWGFRDFLQSMKRKTDFKEEKVNKCVDRLRDIKILKRLI